MAPDDRRHPDAEQLAEYADGLLSAEASADVARHLVECADCRAVVADTMDLLIAGSGGHVEGELPARVIPFRSRRWVTGVVAGLAAAAAILAVVVLPRSSWWDRPPFAALDLAYASQRTVELRLPHAGYGPLVVTRGASDFVQPPAVLDALSIIRRRLQAPDPAARWYHANGTAALLMWQYDEAIASLEHAADLGDQDSDLWIDLASAYFERAEGHHTPHDYTKAIELLTRSLAGDPTNAAALFNRGVVFAKLKQFDAAISDFDAAIKLEHDPGWANEIRSRRQEAQDERARLLGSAAVQIPSEFIDETAFEDVLRRAELRPSDGPERARVQALALRLSTDHHDQWLFDALHATASRDESPGLATLAALARVRERVRIADYALLADPIDRLSRQELSGPLAVWRDFEILYRASHAGPLTECPDSSELLARASRSGYRWFEAQIALEASTCFVGSGRFDQAQDATARAIAIADASSLRVTSLRARGFLSSHLVNEGRYQESFRVDQAALAEIVRSGYPTTRAHQFYDGMMRASEALGRWTEASAAAHMAAQVANASGYQLLAALSAYKEASLAEASGRRDLAAQAYAAAAEEFRTLPPTDEVRAYQAFVEIGGLANRRDYASLLERRAQLHESHNAFFEVPLLTALAHLALERHDLAAAEAYGEEALSYGAKSSTSPSVIRREFAEVLARADVSVVIARLERGDARGALRAWNEHLLRLAASIAPGGSRESREQEIGGGSALLTVADLDGRVAFWLQTADGISFRWGSRSSVALAADLRDLVFLCRGSRGDANAIAAHAENIERDTIGPLWSRGASPNPVYVRASGEMGWLQLAFSLAEPRRTIVLNPFGLTVRPPLDVVDTATFLAVPGASRTADANLPALPNAEREARRLASSIPDARLGIGSAVTARAVDVALGHSRLVHFAGHAVRTADGTALVVSPDPVDAGIDARQGLWHLRSDTDVRAELVVLSACSTAAIERADSSAPNSLAEGVILGGAQSVVATLWEVDSDVTERFNQAFYQSLARNRSIVQSYHDAQQDLRLSAESPAWAAFALYMRLNKE